MGAGMRWTRSRLPRTTTIGVLFVAMVVLPGAGTAAARTSDADIAYGCEFPSGPQQVRVRVTASLPAEGTAGQAVQPGDATVAVTLAQPALADVRTLEAATIGASVRLTVQAGVPGAAETTVWQDLVAPQTELVEDGDVTLVSSGAVPPSTPTAAGRAAFVAGRLDVELVPRKTDGTATSPASIRLACTPVIGYDTTIGTVAMTAPGGAPVGRATAPAGRGTALAEGDDVLCPAAPAGAFNPKFPLPAIPPDSVVQTGEVTPESHACALVAGLSNVAKLKGAAPVAGTGSIGLNLRTVINPDLNYLSPAGIVDANLEPQRATLLTFGFMPVSATMELTQIGNMNVVTEGPFFSIPPLPPLVATISGDLALRLTDARVNGVPLDLGPDCRTVRPVELVLRGSDQATRPYILQPGGTLSGEITIPPFTGCGVGEDLDPLLTASVSGPGNHVRAVQGPLCPALGQTTLANPCPPVPYGVTVSPGGEWTATAGELAMQLVAATPDFVLSCSSVEMDGTFKTGTGLDLPDLGTVTGFEMECSGAGPPLTGKEFVVTPRDLPWTIDTETFDPATGTTEGHFRGVSLHVSSDGCSFDLSDPTATRARGRFNFQYSNSTHTMALRPTGVRAELNISNIQGCASGFTRPIRTTDRMPFTADLVLDPPQTLTAP